MPYPRRLPSGKWQATVKHPSGQRFTKSDPLKRVVMDWAVDLELQIRRGTFIDPNAGKVRLSEWWAKWQAGRTVAKATASKNESHWRLYVQPAFGKWPLDSIQPSDVREWVKSLVAREVGPETVATSLRLLRQLLDAAVEDRKLRENPAAGVRAPTPPKHIDRFLDLDEAQRIIDNVTRVVRDRQGIPRNERQPREVDFENQVFIKLMLDAGLRWEEAAGQHVFRIDLRRRRLRVREVIERGPRIKLVPKTEAGERWVPLTDELVTMLRRLLEDHPGDGLLFREKAGGPLDYSNWLKRVWNPAVKAAGVVDPQPTPHDCRHSYGSWLADEGVQAHDIAKLMGHASLRAVEIYIHASEGRMQRARDALGARRAHGPVEGGGDSGVSPEV